VCVCVGVVCVVLKTPIKVVLFTLLASWKWTDICCKFDVFSLGTINNTSSRQTQPVYYFIIIRVATCFDPVGVIIRPSLWTS